MNKSIFLLLIIFTNFSLSESYTEVSSKLGIHFKHQDGRSNLFHMTETTGSGLGWIDFNNDNKMDLVVVNGFNGDHKLFKNKGDKFSDVTATQLGPTTESRGMGICSADINQDGWNDFLITNYGDDMLYINQGGNKFIIKALTSHKHKWSTGCAFGDLDNDGDLDLYVARYVEYNLNGNKNCNTNIAIGVCNPTDYRGANDSIYINDGYGGFSERTINTGIHSEGKDRGFAVVISDYNQDGFADIYVANDGSENRLYINNGKAEFTDYGLLHGAAINFNGVSEASMGLAIGDINNDLLQDIVVSHFSLETNTIYQNQGNSLFTDTTQSMGLNQSSYMSMGWGIALIDIDNSGSEDLIVANGHINDFINKVDARQTYKQANQIFLNNGNNKLLLQENKKSFFNSKIKSSRGMAVADWNNDGKIDLAFNNIDDEISVFKNTNNNSNNWLGISLKGNKVNSSAIGAAVIVTAGKLKQRKEIISGGSFMSQSDFRLIFGLGTYKDKLNVLVIWPDGKQSKHKINKLNQYVELNYN